MGVFSEILIYVPRERKHITGERIRGIVKFYLDEDAAYKSIALSLVGRGYFQWRQSFNVNPSSRSNAICYAREKKLVQKLYFLNMMTDENITLRAGSYEHPFEIIVPENIPPSVITSIGEIKYNLVLKFKSTATFSWNKIFKKRITIYPRIDSLLPELPVVAKLDKTLIKLFSSKKHEINLEVVLDKGYLTPCGQRNISFTLINNSDVIFTIKTELISKTKYTDDFNGRLHKSKVIDLCTVETPQIPDNSESNLFNVIRVAPGICTVRHSEIMNREYILRVTLKLPMPHVNSSVDIPVFVGESSVRYADEAGMAFGEAVDEPPPPYWEAMYEDNKNDDD